MNKDCMNFDKETEQCRALEKLLCRKGNCKFYRTKEEYEEKRMQSLYKGHSIEPNYGGE